MSVQCKLQEKFPVFARNLQIQPTIRGVAEFSPGGTWFTLRRVILRIVRHSQEIDHETRQQLPQLRVGVSHKPNALVSFRFNPENIRVKVAFKSPLSLLFSNYKQ